jgi:hypothetical protein
LFLLSEYVYKGNWNNTFKLKTFTLINHQKCGLKRKTSRPKENLSSSDTGKSEQNKHGIRSFAKVLALSHQIYA